MHEPVGYLLTWTCYGTWLHGDERGSVDRPRNVPDEPFVPPNLARLSLDRAKLRHPPVRLSEDARRVVYQTITRHCEFRSWSLHVVNVRTNHVHVVVSCGCTPARAREEFKAWCTRLLREAVLCDKNAPVWTEGGSGGRICGMNEL